MGEHMDAMESQLRETYGRWETDQLIELVARGGLTETAERVLRAELECRNVAKADIANEGRRQASPIGLRSELAPLSSRLLAAIFDFWGPFIVVVGINYLVFISAPKPVSDFVGWLSIVVFIVYLLFKDGFNGQSLGKRLLHIQVVDCNDGTPCSLPKSFLRGLVGMLGLLDLVFVLTRRRQRLADHAASTIVVRK